MALPTSVSKPVGDGCSSTGDSLNDEAAGSALIGADAEGLGSLGVAVSDDAGTGAPSDTALEWSANLTGNAVTELEEDLMTYLPVVMTI